jgi:DNA (cytosine-5)-methyltransferase 1
VFVIGNLGDWRHSAAVLFEPESLRRNPPPSREARKSVAGTIGARTCRSIGAQDAQNQHLIPDVAATVLSGAPNDGGPGHGARSGHAKDSTLIPEIVGALSDGAHCGGGLNGQDAYSGRIIPWSSEIAGALTAKGPEALGAPEVDANHYIVHGTQDPITSDIAMPLQEKNGGSVNAVIAFKPGQSADAHSVGAQEDVACTLEGGEGGNNRQAIAFAQNQRDEVRVMDVAGALAAEPGAKQQTYVSESSVRRLTPLECERLQGFPDGYTKIPKCSDSGRYKALGNSMAVPVMSWIGHRIMEVNDG